MRERRRRTGLKRRIESKTRGLETKRNGAERNERHKEAAGVRDAEGILINERRGRGEGHGAVSNANSGVVGAALEVPRKEEIN